MKTFNIIMTLATAAVIGLMPMGSLVAVEQVRVNNQMNQPVMDDFDMRVDRPVRYNVEPDGYRYDRYDRGCIGCHRVRAYEYRDSCCRPVRTCYNCERRGCCDNGGFFSGVVNFATAPIFWITDGMGGRCCNNW